MATAMTSLWSNAIPLIAVMITCVAMFMAIGIRSQTLRALLLHLVAFCQGVHLKWVTDPHVAFQILNSSGDKGNLIESLLSVPAWRPIISLESVNGDQWQRMKSHFSKLTKVLQPISQLTTIFETRSQELLKSETVIDALRLNELLVAGFYEWVFRREFVHEKCAVACEATWEWRKQLALKGFADQQVKQRTIEWCLDEIRCTPRLYEVFGDKWVEPEYYSLILQPFMLSPAINMTDVAVIIKEWTRTTPLTEPITPEILRQCICSAHPFPVVERFFPHGNAELGISPNTHVLVPLDEIAGDAFVGGVDLSFGAGARVCAGRHMAMKAMAGLFTDSFVRSDKFQPGLHHKYSGRHNDGKETMGETLYQLHCTIRTIGAVVMKRILKACASSLPAWRKNRSLKPSK